MNSAQLEAVLKKAKLKEVYKNAEVHGEVIFKDNRNVLITLDIREDIPKGKRLLANMLKHIEAWKKSLGLMGNSAKSALKSVKSAAIGDDEGYVDLGISEDMTYSAKQFAYMRHAVWEIIGIQTELELGVEDERIETARREIVAGLMEVRRRVMNAVDVLNTMRDKVKRFLKEI